MDPTTKSLLSKNVAVFSSWQWREPEHTLESVKQECIEYLKPFAPAEVRHFTTTAANIDDYGENASDGFFAMLDELKVKPADCVVFLHTDNLFQLCENQIEFFSWLRVIQSHGGEVYFIRQEACTASSVKDFLPRIQY